MSLVNLALVFLAEVAEYNEYFVKGLACLGAGIAMVAEIGPALGEGNIGAKAVEAVGKQPEASDKIRSTLLFADALAETTGIYALIVAILLMFAV